MNKYIKFGLNFLRGRKTIKDIILRNSSTDTRRELCSVLDNIEFEKYEVFCDSSLSAIKPSKDSKINIFIFWYEGWNTGGVPKVLLKCKTNLLKFYECQPFYNIVFLDQYNIFEYVYKEDILYSEFLNKKVSIQTLSDLLRLAVLLKHGGIWLDSTILFLGDKFDFRNLYYYSEFNSILNENFNPKRYHCFASYKGYEQYWCTFMLSAWKQSNIVDRAYNFLKYYIKEQNYKNIYFSLDLAIMFATYKTNGVSFNKCGYEVYEIMQSYYDFSYKNKSTLFYKSSPFKMNWRIDTTRHIKAIEKYIQKSAKK